MKQWYRNIMTEAGRLFNSPWHRLAESRLQLIERQRLTIEQQQSSIASLIDLLHATEDSLAIQRDRNADLLDRINTLEYLI